MILLQKRKMNKNEKPVPFVLGKNSYYNKIIK